MCVCVFGSPSLGVLWQTEAQIDDRKSCELLPQVQHLRVSVVIQLHTNRDTLTVPLTLGQTKTLTTITVARITAHCVDTSPVTHI